MDLIELLKRQERLREHYWANFDYFLPTRLKWRAQMVRHFFHLFPENSILELVAVSCQWTREISAANANRNPICSAILNKELYEANNHSSFSENIERIHLDTLPGKLSNRRFDFIVGYQLFTDENAGSSFYFIKQTPQITFRFFDTVRPGLVW